MGHSKWTGLLTWATIPLTEDTGGTATGPQAGLQTAALTTDPWPQEVNAHQPLGWAPWPHAGHCTVRAGGECSAPSL